MSIEEGVSTATTKEEATAYTMGFEFGISATKKVGFLGNGAEGTVSASFSVGMDISHSFAVSREASRSVAYSA